MSAWYAVPAISYDTDDGFGLGARGAIAWPAEVPGEPYRLEIVLHVFFAVSGFQHHRFQLDRPGLGPNHRTRFTLYVAWRQWLHDGYFGIGDDTVRDLAPAAYDYRLYQPVAQITVRHDLGDHGLGVYGAFDPKYSAVDPYPGSLLAEERPYGVGGGLGLQVRAGAYSDTRDPEIAPRRGHWFELGARGAPDAGGEAGGFWGPNAQARGYAALGSRVVLAGRLMGEWLFGSVPFYEEVQWGGAMPTIGFGGPDTLRGVEVGRWRAPGKAVGNVELRTDVVKTHLKDEPVVGELTPFVDAGTVWGAGPWAGVHPSAGLGVRVVYASTFILRIDSGLGWDPVPGGPDTTFGFYLTFDHPF